MAKKKPAKKKTTKKTAPPVKKAGGGAKSSASKSTKKASKKTTKKTASKVTKKVSKKKVVKKTTKKPSSKTATTKKKTVKKAAPKTVKKPVAKKKSSKANSKTAQKTTKKIVKKTVKKSASKAPAKKAPAKKASTKKAPAKKAPAKVSKAPAKSTKKAPVKKVEEKKVEEKKPSQPVRRRTRSSKAKKPLILPDRPLLLGPNGPSLKPLISTGSDVKRKKSVLDNVTSRRTKTPLTKTQLEAYRMTLLQKRAELLGDVRHLEEEALGVPGSVNTKSKHADEQGSESYEQSLSLNLAASDRKMINEIDDALARIDDRTFGLCEVTFEPIKKARLDELPWARHTIHAAREMDRRGGS